MAKLTLQARPRHHSEVVQSTNGETHRNKLGIVTLQDHHLSATRFLYRFLKMRGTHVAALSGLILTSFAHPHHASSSNGIEARQVAGNRFEQFRPVQRSTYVPEGEVSIARVPSAGGDYVEVATAHLRSIHPEAEFRQVGDNHVSSSGVGHVYFKQTLNGIDIDDADFNVCISLPSRTDIMANNSQVNVRPDGTILSYGDSFYTGPTPAAAPAPAEVIEPQPALETVVDVLGLPIDAAEAQIVEESEQSFTVQGLSNVESPPDGQLVYYRTADGTLVSAWRIETDLGDNWLTTYLDAENDNNVLAVTDYVADTAERYQVL